MKHTVDDLLNLLEKLPRDSYYFIWNDYKAIQEMQKANLISALFAELEFERLYEEASNLVERQNNGS